MCFKHVQLGGDPWDDPGHLSWLAWDNLEILLERLEKVFVEREVWASLIKPLPPQPMIEKI